MVRSHCTFSGHYTTAGAMASSKEEFSGNFYMKFLAFVALALCVVGMAFVVMNHWLATLPSKEPPPMMPGQPMQSKARMPGDFPTNFMLGGAGNTVFKGLTRVHHYHVNK
mmetsp:Transcript_48982/g.153843  ORF Transcript_48982/g.153843 Transcript_48982/m.153843 type:complete len:110 (-) Transcript_48982:232-561(-)